MKKLADIIVFDIVDEMSDEEGFDAWWHGLCAEKRDRLTAIMSTGVEENILRQCAVNAARMAKEKQAEARSNFDHNPTAAAIGGTGGCLNS